VEDELAREVPFAAQCAVIREVLRGRAVGDAVQELEIGGRKLLRPRAGPGRDQDKRERCTSHRCGSRQFPATQFGGHGHPTL
jgi:hypothetical protein